MKTMRGLFLPVLAAVAFAGIVAVQAQTVPFRRIVTITNGAAVVRMDRPFQLQTFQLAGVQASGTNTLSTGTVAVVTAAAAGAVTSALPSIVTTGTAGASNGFGRFDFPSSSNVQAFAGDLLTLRTAGTNGGLWLLQGLAPQRAE